MKELLSWKDNYHSLKTKLREVRHQGALPYLGMYLEESSIIKESMPDMLEPQHLINFAKREKMAQLINEIVDYKTIPYCLQPVPIIQRFLSKLDIYVYSEVCAIADQYQEAEGDYSIPDDIFSMFSGILSLETNEGRRRSADSNGGSRRRVTTSDEPRE